MKHFLFLLSTILFLTSCSDDNDSTPSGSQSSNNPSNNSAKSYWKVTSRQGTTFKFNGDTLSSSGFSSPTSIDSVYLQIQGDDLTLFTVAADSTFSRSVTMTTTGNSPYFSINNSDILDTSFANGNSDFISFSGNIPIHIRGVSFLFYSDENSGKMGTIEFESIETELPSPNWTIADHGLFVDWKTFFQF